MKRPLITVAFALSVLLSPSVYGAAKEAEYKKVFTLGQQAAEVAAKVGIAQCTLSNDKLKKAYQKKAIHECVRGTVTALKSLDVDATLQEHLGWFQRKYVETKLSEIIAKLRDTLHDLSARSLKSHNLSQVQEVVLRDSYIFGEHVINQSIDVALKLGVIADEQKRKKFGKRFAVEFTAGIENTICSLDIKAIAKQQNITLADNQVELVKIDMQKQIKRMRETIESGALGEFLAIQE